MKYSNEKRDEILGKIKEGMSKADVVRNYGVSARTIFYWLKRTQYRSYTPKKSGPKGSYKFNRNELRELVKNNPNMTLSEMSKYFNVSTGAIHHALKGMKFRYQKNNGRYIWRIKGYKIDKMELEVLIQDRPYITLREISDIFDVTISVAYGAIKSAGYKKTRVTVGQWEWQVL